MEALDGQEKHVTGERGLEHSDKYRMEAEYSD
jgi:hypothetical protein